MKKIHRKDPHVWEDVTIAPGESRELQLHISESYSGLTVPIPVLVRRGREEGPTVFVSAAIHGDEINGTGSIRALVRHERIELLAGTLILLPVINILGFDRKERYLPDRRDLNRCFPGSRKGSLAKRMARVIFDEIIGRSDYGIDLHTAAVRRTNFPNVRADASIPDVARLAKAFGCEVVLASHGPPGSLRREACAVGCPTIILEGGEVWKVEPTIVQCAVRGIRNVLIELGMVEGEPIRPPYQVLIRETKWIRAETGGFLRFHVSPGDVVDAGDPLATNTTLLGEDRNLLIAPFPSIVLGMTTLPAITPGEPVCQLGRLTKGHEPILKARQKLPASHPHEQLMDDLATNVMVVERKAGEGNDGAKP